jgi:hypothetical protein
MRQPADGTSAAQTASAKNLSATDSCRHPFNAALHDPPNGPDTGREA